MNEMNERITELEIRYAHQSVMVEEMNEILTSFCGRVEALERENRRLKETLSRLAPVLEESPDE